MIGYTSSASSVDVTIRTNPGAGGTRRGGFLYGKVYRDALSCPWDTTTISKVTGKPGCPTCYCPMQEVMLDFQGYEDATP